MGEMEGGGWERKTEPGTQDLVAQATWWRGGGAILSYRKVRKEMGLGKKKKKKEFCLQQVKFEMPFKCPGGNGNRQQDTDV